ncbi:hypothetical protein [Pseudomonas typographi]|uniref:Uncharacterized protein n=1 Tax=Pseudomonas typographi TaxID=2715964 RepID=A0ABR7YZH6_9PSED|nr:hypothetical protein [Pseudomonas typographi]MBD1553581.1 hypothetical protein [Pseudomonas typographi]MBD1586730.1 hypothetical protein [Pseudomonas typographi]MBD1598624.1 hypothetical protein [Pseudomonas typographi]MBD1601148.1 hypothetical protein [Pseudomonas typographi]
MKTHTAHTNITTYTATVSEADVTRALCGLLAQLHGLNLDEPGVRIRGYHSSEDTSTGYKHFWKIEVIVDHSLEARPHADEA